MPLQKSTPLFSESDARALGEHRQDTSEFKVIFVHSRLDDYGLPAPAFRVYGHLARRAGRGIAWSAVENMARICRLHPQTVRKSLELLTAHGMLQAEIRPGKTTLYRLNPTSMWRPTTRIDVNVSDINTTPSISQGGPINGIQGQSCETDTGEGIPREGSPGKKLQTHIEHHLPSSEDEAVKETHALGIPADFARQEFNRMVAVGWLDGCQRPVRSWQHYIKQRWSREQRERVEPRASGGKSPKRPPAPPRHFSSSDYNQPV